MTQEGTSFTSGISETKNRWGEPIHPDVIVHLHRNTLGRAEFLIRNSKSALSTDRPKLSCLAVRLVGNLRTCRTFNWVNDCAPPCQGSQSLQEMALAPYLGDLPGDLVGSSLVAVTPSLGRGRTLTP